MKRFLFNNWRVKLMSLVVAAAVWYLIRKNVESSSEDYRLERRPSVLKATPT